MKKDSLLNSNRWLREPQQRKALLHLSAASSSAIEGIIKPFSDGGTRLSRPAAKRGKSAPARG